MPIAYFFEDMEASVANKSPSRLMGVAETRHQPVYSLDDDPLSRRETLELVRAYYRIDEVQVRKRVFELTKALAKPPL